MPSDAAQQLIEQAERSGLIPPAQAREALAQLTVDGAVTTEKAAEHLVEKKVLTSYQVEQLIAGKGQDCVIAGRYHVLDKLGEGGMGAVYKARDTKLERLVAVKVLPAGRLHDGDAIARFQREAKALARLSHPHIIQAFDSGDERGRHFLVMEFVEGVTLDKVLRQHGALAPTLAADLIHQTALGLQHAHEKGLIHRDLKPANLLVAGLTAAPWPSVHFRETMDYPETPSPQRLKPTAATVKILDLGLARFLQDQLGDAQITQEGAGMGTPDYMAPEQFRDALHADARTDIYGLGCTLYHLIAGSVPFPGTSFSEKAHAHAKKEPIPLEERCPEVPAGLAFIVQKMMAKHPAERYQSAGEIAEALAPYVAGSSHSVIRMRETGRWPPGQLTMRAPRRAPRVLPWALGTGVLVIAGLLLIVAWPRLFPADPVKNEPAPIAKIPDAKTDAPKPGDPPKPDAKPKPEPVKPKVVTIENGLTVAKDGTGEYDSIQKALDHIKPGQTIRVLDGATYAESLLINKPALHKGIRLESIQRATLTLTKEISNGIVIDDVPEVGIHGFDFKGPKADRVRAFVRIHKNATGVVLSDLQFDAAEMVTGVKIDKLSIPASAEPLVIRNCRFRVGYDGILVSGPRGTEAAKSATTTIRLEGNRFHGCLRGIHLEGAVGNLLIAGNIVAECTQEGIGIEDLNADMRRILIMNNSLHRCGFNFRIWDNPPHEKRTAGQVEFRANVCSEGVDSDLGYIQVAPGAPDGDPPAGDSKALLKLWAFTNNRRDLSGSLAKYRILLSNDDQKLSARDLDSGEWGAPSFLRPGAKTSLVTSGAGGDLPGYVGAVPPEGTTPWDWQWTWDASANKLLTVSKESKSGGRFRTINNALKAVQPGMTIRVLDDATYAETLIINNATQHDGLVLEARKRATLLLSANAQSALTIENVTRVRVRGFLCREQPAGRLRDSFFVTVVGRCPGVVIEELDIDGKVEGGGILAKNVRIEADEEPVTIKKCTIQTNDKHGDGIAVVGIGTEDIRSPQSRVCIQENRILRGGRGILLFGAVTDVLVAGNVLCNCQFSCLALEERSRTPDRILFANNTAFDSGTLARFWENAPFKERAAWQVEFANNLFFNGQHGDVRYIRDAKDGKQPFDADATDLMKLWRFKKNWRDQQGANQSLPLAAEDKKLEKNYLRSRNPEDRDFLRPLPESPLAKEGAGGELPSYVGAVPPEGATPWDWKWTWDAFVNKRLTVSKDPKSGGRYRTINEALESVRPSQTIRVLDGETYQEVLNIVRPATQTGIVLEAVKGATLSFPKCKLGLSISNVPRVTVRGFKLRHEAEILYMIGSGGRCQGLRLEQLDIKITADLTGAITMESIEPGGEVSIVENCVIKGGFVGLRVSGYTNYSHPNPCGTLVLRNNTILESGKGISIQGSINQLHVAGNRIAFAGISGIQLENLLTGTEDILIVNNTMLDCGNGFRLWDDGKKQNWGERIRIVNNLVLGSPGRDMLFLDSGGDPNKLRGPGDGRLLLKAWHWESNWRETEEPSGTDIFFKSWIPVAPADKRLSKIDVLSRIPSDPDFLRPAQTSLLTTSGAGRDLPPYVGAVPPRGVESWDWSKVWQARFKKKAEK